ncbi:MAG: HEAT repeat domain-containing protein [Cyclobacteriaceae bacterium]
MKKEITDEELLELIEGNPNQELEQLISEDKGLGKRFQELKEVLVTISDAKSVDVPAHIEMNFREAIFNEQSRQGTTFSWMHIAAAVTILILGFGLGRFSEGSSSSELASLKDEVNALKEVTLTSALQRYSASERIMAVNQIEASTQKVNPELISTLINTLNSDESPNVRYAALQALSNYIDNTDVRAELVKSLESQNDALIQISLISILVEAEERSAIAPLKDIIDKEEIAPEVRQQAEIAIQVLT